MVIRTITITTIIGIVVLVVGIISTVISTHNPTVTMMTSPTILMSRGTSGVGVDGDLPQDLPSTRVSRPQYGATYHVWIHGVDRMVFAEEHVPFV